MSLEKSTEFNEDLITEMLLEANKGGVQEGKLPAIWLPMKEQGSYACRVVPAGNKEQGIPFKKYSLHKYYDENSKSPFKYRDVLCWHYVMEDIPTATKLSELQKLTIDDIEKYRQFACPYCNADAAMEAAGVDRKARAKLRLQSQFAMNVFLRGKYNKIGQIEEGETGNRIYIWDVPYPRWVEVFGYRAQIIATDNFDILDTRSGRDMTIKATGEGAGNSNPRRYSVQWGQMSKPLGCAESDVHDLTEYVSRKFKDYQASIDYIKAEFAEKFALMRYQIPGDLNAKLHSDIVPGTAKPLPKVSELRSPHETTKDVNADYTYVKDGVLYAADGTPMF